MNPLDSLPPGPVTRSVVELICSAPSPLVNNGYLGSLQSDYSQYPNRPGYGGEGIHLGSRVNADVVWQGDHGSDTEVLKHPSAEGVDHQNWR